MVVCPAGLAGDASCAGYIRGVLSIYLSYGPQKGNYLLGPAEREEEEESGSEAALPSALPSLP